MIRSVALQASAPATRHHVMSISVLSRLKGMPKSIEAIITQGQDKGIASEEKNCVRIV